MKRVVVFSVISLFIGIGLTSAGFLSWESDFVSGLRSPRVSAAYEILEPPTQALDVEQILKEHPKVVQCIGIEGARQEECVNDYLKKTSMENGPRMALDVIESLSQKYPILSTWAHPFAHTIGDYAVKYYENLGLSLEAQIGRGIVSCDGYGSFGCYHGIIEVATSKISPSERPAILRKACFDDPAIASQPYFVQQCAHWFGHSMTIFTDTPLIDVLQMCQDVDPDWGHGGVQLCLSGVFHSGLAPGDADDDEIVQRNIKKVFKEGDPYYPCLDIPERFRGHCYSHAYGRAMVWDLSIQLQTCNNIPESDPVKKRTYVAGCYDSVGNNVIEMMDFDPQQVVEACKAHASPEYRGYCYGGAARYWVLRNPLLENTKPLEMCSMVEEEAKPFCYARAGFGNYENFASREILDQFCVNVEPAYQKFCMKRTAPDDFTGGYVEVREL